jgi:hypothetical protein
MKTIKLPKTHPNPTSSFTTIVFPIKSPTPNAPDVGGADVCGKGEVTVSKTTLVWLEVPLRGGAKEVGLAGEILERVNEVGTPVPVEEVFAEDDVDFDVVEEAVVLEVLEVEVEW